MLRFQRSVSNKQKGNVKKKLKRRGTPSHRVPPNQALGSVCLVCCDGPSIKHKKLKFISSFLGITILCLIFLFITFVKYEKELMYNCTLFFLAIMEDLRMSSHCILAIPKGNLTVFISRFVHFSMCPWNGNTTFALIFLGRRNSFLCDFILSQVLLIIGSFFILNSLFVYFSRHIYKLL